MLRALAPRVETDLNAPERLTLISDEWALVRAGRHGVGDYLTLAAGFGREHSSGVLQEVAARLSFVNEYLTTDATRPAFATFVRTLVRPLFDELGLAGAGSENDERKSLRAVAVGALGNVGQDPDVIAGARAALDRALAGGPALDPTLAGTMTATAASHGDLKLFEALAAAADRATSPEERYRNLYSLGRFTDPAIIDRGLDRALSQVRPQDTAIYLGQFFGNPAARSRAWTFLTSHWTELQPKLMIFGSDTNLTRALSSFCDAASRDEIVSFFAAHPLPAAARTLTQTVERINNCIAVSETETRTLTAWLATSR
jgi:aminopeptidase N